MLDVGTTEPLFQETSTNNLDPTTFMAVGGLATRKSLLETKRACTARRNGVVGMITKDKKALILGIIMCVLGVLLLSGQLGDVGQWLVFITAIVLIIVGVLMVAKQLPGSMLIGVVMIVLGALVILPNDTFPELEALFGIIDLMIGVLLLVFGVLKIVGK